MTSFSRRHASICRAIICIILVTFTVACTSMQTIPLTDREALTSLISVGEKVEVTRHDGEVSTFIVDQFSESGIGGDGYFVEYDDIEQIRVARDTGSIDDSKMLWIILGIALVIVALGNGPQEIQGF